MRQQLVLVVLVVSLACAAPVAQPAPAVSVLLPAQASPADRAEATELFTHWLDENVRRPGATFHLIGIGSSRADVQPRFAAVIPDSWGAPNAAANKAAFVTRTRHAFLAALTTSSAAAIERPTSAAETTITVLPRLDSRGVRWTWNITGGPLHAATVCDASPSAAGAACTPDALLHSYDAWLARGVIVGSSFRVWVVGINTGSAARAFEITTPDLPLDERVAVLLAARQEVVRVVDQAHTHAGSAIAEALTVAITDLAGRQGGKRLFVLSDLRQTTPGVWAFDQHVPSAKTFVEWLDGERLLPESRDIAIQVCGLHFGPAPGHASFDARHAAELKAVWIDAFAAMHPASLSMHGQCDADTFANAREVRQ